MIMGGGRDKRKKAKGKKEGPSVGRSAEKTERKTRRKEERRERQVQERLEGDEDDIDALLAKFFLEDSKRKAVHCEYGCLPPSARVNASFTAYIAPGTNDIILFGGEYTELRTGRVHVNNDLYRYHVDKQKWSRISCPNSPPPRCAHQAVIHKGCMYVFGGEFVSPSQERFHHYKDLWRLELASGEWDHLPGKGGPSARSGHRMVVYQNKALLFGGFYDNGREVKYYNDLWELDMTAMKWQPVNCGPGPQPSPRGGCQMAVCGDCMYLVGGYSRVADENDKDMEHGIAHDDMWSLNLMNYQWSRIKKVGTVPSPRASFSMALHKDRLVVFGGVSDHEAKRGEDLSSDFHNDLYVFSIVKQRWFAAGLDVRMVAKQGQEQQGLTLPSQSSSPPCIQDLIAQGRDPNSGVYKAAVRIQAQFRGYVVRKAFKVYKLGGQISEVLYSPASFGVDLTVNNLLKPRGRISSQMCVVGNHLWLLGGVVEVGSKEITLDDLWCLDLNKMDGWRLIRENTVGEEVFHQDGSSDEWEDLDGEEEEEEEGEEKIEKDKKQ